MTSLSPSGNPVHLDAVPAPPLQMNTQRMTPRISTSPNIQRPKRPTTRVNGRQLTSDDRDKMGWMNIVLQ